MSKKVLGVHQATNLKVPVAKLTTHISEFFFGDEKRIETFIKILEELTICDHDIYVLFDRGTISCCRQNGNPMVFASPTRDGYEISFFSGMKENFDTGRLSKYISECEKSVMADIRNSQSNDTTQTDLKQYLNQEQRHFCTLPANKNVRLLAPAGSGKTYALLWRCKCITDECARKGKDTPNFLLVTFTRAAAAEIEKRLKDNTEFSNIRANVRTLNSWGWEQIKENGKELVTKKLDRRALLTHDLLSLVQKNDTLNRVINVTKQKGIRSDFVMDMMDLLKALGFTHNMKKSEYNSHKKEMKELGVEELLEQAFQQLFIFAGINTKDRTECGNAENDFFEFWKKATIRLKDNNRFSHEDQKYWANQYLLEKMSKGIYPRGLTRYTHVIIDEFQDVNPLDIALVNSIVKYNSQSKPVNLTIVGDDDQAIFGWRGTTPQFILAPEKYLSGKFETCVLKNNYRSPKAIVAYSRQLICHNSGRVNKEMKSVAKGTAVVKVVSKQRISDTDVTMDLIHKLLDSGCKQIALIGRKQASIFPYQVILSAEKIQYNVEADVDIYEGEAMTSLMEIIRIIYRAKDIDNDNVVDELLTAFDKVGKYPLKKSARDEIMEYLNSCDIESFEDAFDALTKEDISLSDALIANKVEVVRNLLYAKSVYDFMECAATKLEGLGKAYDKADLDNHYKEPQFLRITKLAKNYGEDFRRFYRDIERARKVGEMCRRMNSTGNGNEYSAIDEIPVHLLTATRAKGHEFDAVIILEANDHEWPHYLSDNIEEERRLFYVAMTRARKYLYFVSMKDSKISRFVKEAGVEMR